MARAPTDSIVALASRLVATPSCGGIDAPDAVLALVEDWLRQNGLAARLLRDGANRPVAVLAEIVAAAPGPLLCLDACIDTAPAGDVLQWREPPFSGVARDGRLLGRGAADSKAGVAILCHVARTLASSGLPRGKMHVLFDADEHTGRFGGVRAYLDSVGGRLPDAVSLGYPGHDCVVAGSRGFLRACLHLSGRAAHSGEAERTGINALTRAARFALRVEEAAFPGDPDPAFPFGPAATVTRIEGGEGFSVVPDRATCHIDVRLTRTFEGERAMAWLESIARPIDGDVRIEPVDHWPAYLVAPDHLLVQSFSQAAGRAFGRPVPVDVCGPSNIGNLLAARGVPTICAPGVGFGNIHAANEWADLASIAPVYAMYCEAALDFLGRG